MIDVDAFHKDGVACVRGVLTEHEIESLRAAVDDQVGKLGSTSSGYDFEEISRQIWQNDSVDVGDADRFDIAFIKDRVRDDGDARPLLEDESSSDGMFFYDAAGWRRYRGIADVALRSALPRTVASLWPTEYVTFWEDTTFVKAPGTRQKTAFHQDLAYFQISGTQCAVCWIPLDPANLSNGVTRYIPGSHRWGETYAPNLVVSQTPTSAAVDPKCPDIEGNEDAYEFVSFDVEPGDVIIHDVRTIHGAGGNPSNRNRRALSFRYCGDDVRYFDRQGAIPQQNISHSLKDGDPLPCSDYPIVWSRSGAAA